eukprot:6710618-Prymnesium_polylepis.2
MPGWMLRCDLAWLRRNVAKAAFPFLDLSASSSFSFLRRASSSALRPRSPGCGRMCSRVQSKAAGSTRTDGTCAAATPSPPRSWARSSGSVAELDRASMRAEARVDYVLGVAGGGDIDGDLDDEVDLLELAVHDDRRRRPLARLLLLLLADYGVDDGQVAPQQTGGPPLVVRTVAQAEYLELRSSRRTPGVAERRHVELQLAHAGGVEADHHLRLLAAARVLLEKGHAVLAAIVLEHVNDRIHEGRERELA